jgi:hypothetical protein
MVNAKPVPADDYEVKTFEFHGEYYTVRTKFKMVKFFRLLDENPVLAIQEALEEPSYKKLEEIDIEMDDFKDLLEKVAKAISGDTAGN